MKPVAVFVFLALIAASFGCEETVTPFVEEERPFTVFGYLDPTTSLQVLRVIPIAGNINDVGEIDVDASVRTIQAETGAVVTWRKETILFPDSTSGVVFKANFTPAYEQTYRLEVENANAELVTAETMVPQSIVSRRLESGTGRRPGFFIEDRGTNLVQAFMQYEIVVQQPAVSALPDIVHPVSVSYRGQEERITGGMEIRADLFADFEVVQQALADICVTTPFITVRSANFEFFVGDAAWIPPGGEFDEDVLVQPGTFSNVSNGYGFFGAGYGIRFSVPASSGVLQQAGYVPQRPCQVGPGFDASAPECQDIVPCL